MSAAIDDGGNLHARILAAHVERAYTFRSVNLVTGNGGEIDVVFDHIHGNLTDGLNRVGVEQHPTLVTELADLPPGLQHANLVVGRHDGDENRLVVDGALQVVKIDQPIFLDGKVGDAVAVFLQALASVEHRLVLGHGGDDVIALFAIHLGDTLDGQVVALGRARREDNFFGSCADQLRDLLTRRFYARFRGPTRGVVAAGGIAEAIGEVGKHFFQYARIHGRGRVIIHVDGQLDSVGGKLLLQGGRLYIRAHKCVSYLRENRFQPRVTSSASFFASCGAVSSRICDMEMRRSTSSMLRFTLRRGSRIVHRPD